MVVLMLWCRGAAKWLAEGAAGAPGDHGHSKLKVLKKIDSRRGSEFDTRDPLS